MTFRQIYNRKTGARIQKTKDYPPHPTLLPYGEKIDRLLPLLSGERIEVRGKARPQQPATRNAQPVTCNCYLSTDKRIYYEKNAAFLL